MRPAIFNHLKNAQALNTKKQIKNLAFFINSLTLPKENNYKLTKKDYQNWINICYQFSIYTNNLDKKGILNIIPRSDKKNGYSRKLLWKSNDINNFSLIGFNFDNSILLHLYNTNKSPNHELFEEDQTLINYQNIISTPIHNHTCFNCSVLLTGHLQEHYFSIDKYKKQINKIHTLDRTEGSVTIGFPFLITHQVTKKIKSQEKHDYNLQ